MTDPLIPIAVTDPLDLAWYECNDFGNARRLVALSRGLLKWVDDRYWVAFDGQRWSEREGGYRARALAHEVAQHCNDEAVALGELVGDPDRPNVNALSERFGAWCSADRATDRLTLLRRHAIKSGNAAQTAAMLTQARDMPQMRAWSEQFDVDPLTYNVQNGTLRFKRRPAAEGSGSADVASGSMPTAGRESEGSHWESVFQAGHEPGDMLRQIANVEYDPAATCPQWLARLDLVQSDDEQRGVLAMLYGQSLTGLTDGEEFYTHQGKGGDGKSKTHEVLAQLHGDYYRHCPVKTWLAASFQKSGSEHRSDLVRLAGDIRFVSSEEPPRGSKWDSEIIKQATGGGSITARGSGEKSEITYKPRFKLHVEVNIFPAAPGDDRGWWRRQFPVTWPCDTAKLPGGAEPPQQLVDRLSAERSGILNWLVAGCLEWLALRKVPRPATVDAAIASLKTGTSPIGEWLAEFCDMTDRSAREGATVLYTAFKTWAEGQGLDKVPSQRAFGDKLTNEQVYVDKDRRGNKVRCGIRLRGINPLLGDDGTAPRGSDQMSPEATARGAEDDAGGWPDDDLGGWNKDGS